MDDLEREISLHKDRWCRYHCTAKNTKVTVSAEDYIWCQTCREKQYIEIEDESEIGEEACKLCQVDAFIRELIEQKVFTKC